MRSTYPREEEDPDEKKRGLRVVVHAFNSRKSQAGGSPGAEDQPGLPGQGRKRKKGGRKGGPLRSWQYEFNSCNAQRETWNKLPPKSCPVTSAPVLWEVCTTIDNELIV